MTTTLTIIHEPHCSLCGSTDHEDVGAGDGGRALTYSACCDEPVQWGGQCTDDDCDHA